MRISMFVFVVAEERATISQQFDDDGVGFKNIFALVLGQTFQINAAIIERSVRFQSIFLARIKVVRAVAGSGVHDSAALVESDVVGQNARDLKGQKGMPKFAAFKFAALEGFADASF